MRIYKSNWDMNDLGKQWFGGDMFQAEIKTAKAQGRDSLSKLKEKSKS